MKKDKLFNNKVNNQQLKDLNIEYRKRWGVASHVDYTWWETYGDIVFKLGKKQALEDVEEVLHNRRVQIEMLRSEDMKAQLHTFVNHFETEIKQKLEELK